MKFQNKPPPQKQQQWLRRTQLGSDSAVEEVEKTIQSEAVDSRYGLFFISSKIFMFFEFCYYFLAFFCFIFFLLYFFLVMVNKIKVDFWNFGITDLKCKVCCLRVC